MHWNAMGFITRSYGLSSTMLHKTWHVLKRAVAATDPQAPRWSQQQLPGSVPHTVYWSLMPTKMQSAQTAALPANTMKRSRGLLNSVAASLANIHTMSHAVSTGARVPARQDDR